MNYTESNIPEVLQPNDTIEISYSGTYKEISLPAGKYKFECWGAQGGEKLLNAAINNIGAYGGYTYGILSISEKQNFFVYVGQTGSFGGKLNGVWNGGAGGWNGGANGGGDVDDDVGGGGGGASDIRLIGGAWDNITSLRSRIMVAAGGGGSLPEGVGGGLIGGVSFNTTPATQTSGYAFGYGEVGGIGSTSVGYIGKGGGGGGYYGGHSVNTSGSVGDGAGGNGGSSFISGMIGCNAIREDGIHTGQPIHYSGLAFVDGKTESGIRSGNGLIRITFIEKIKYNNILFEVNGEIKYIKDNTLYTLTDKDIQTLNNDDFIKYGINYKNISEHIDLKSLFPDSSNISILKNTIEEKEIQYKFIVDYKPQIILNKKPIILPYKKINKFFINNNNVLYLIQIDEVFYSYQYKYWGQYNFNTPPPIYNKKDEENYIINLSNWLNNINIKDIDNIKRYGMTAEIINNIPEENWNELFPHYINKLRNINFLCMFLNYDNFDVVKLQKIKIYGDKFERQIYLSTDLFLEEQEKTKYTITWKTVNKNKIKILYGM